MSRRACLLAVLVAALCLPLHAFAEPPADSNPAIDKVFSKWDNPDSPGCALGVLRDGKPIYEKGYGSANLDWKIPIDVDTVFYVGSVSKQFTAGAIQLLAQDGKIGLDDDIRKYFPELPDQGPTITVRHLVHHTSGLPDIYRLMARNGHSLTDFFSDQRAIDLIASKGVLEFEPGDRYRYSNSGYFLLAQLFKRVGEGSLRDFAAKRIFGPLDMSNSVFNDTPRRILPRRAMSYSERGGEVRVTYEFNFDKVGAGGLYTTVRDLYQWNANFDNPAVGGREWLAAIQVRGVLNDGTVLPYASGLVHGERQGRKTVGHSGSMMGFKAAFLRIPEEELSLICLCNLNSIEPMQLVGSVADILMEK